MKYKGIIFDMDGTIVHTGRIWEEVHSQMIKSKKKNISKKQIAEILYVTNGSGILPSCHILKKMLDLKDSVESLASELLSLGNAMYQEQLKFVDGFEKFYKDATKKYKLRCGIATNASDSTLKITNEMLNLDSYFGKHIYNITHVNDVYKPDPALYFYAADKLKLKPSECVAIEDSAAGIRAAKAAGMFCIGMNTSGDDTQVEDADFAVTTYHQIDLKWLLKKK